MPRLRMSGAIPLHPSICPYGMDMDKIYILYFIGNVDIVVIFIHFDSYQPFQVRH
jgi:hypothetical protein